MLKFIFTWYLWPVRSFSRKHLCIWCHCFHFFAQSSRKLASHKLSGFIAPELGKLDQLKTLYVLWGFLLSLSIYIYEVADQNLAFELLIICRIHLVSGLFRTTTYMEQYHQNWEIARSCRECMCLLLLFSSHEFKCCSSDVNVLFIFSTPLCVCAYGDGKRCGGKVFWPETSSWMWE